MVASSPTSCLEESLLGALPAGGARRAITLHMVLEAVNMGGLTMSGRPVASLLGGVRREGGRVVGAEAATLTWVGEVNTTAVREVGSAQRGEQVDGTTLALEAEMVAAVEEVAKEVGEGVAVLPNIQRMLLDSLEGQVGMGVGEREVGVEVVLEVMEGGKSWSLW